MPTQARWSICFYVVGSCTPSIHSASGSAATSCFVSTMKNSGGLIGPHPYWSFQESHRTISLPCITSTSHHKPLDVQDVLTVMGIEHCDLPSGADPHPMLEIFSSFVHQGVDDQQRQCKVIHVVPAHHLSSGMTAQLGLGITKKIRCVHV